MKKLRSLSAARLAALQRLVDARTTGGEDAAREVLATGEGPRLMEQLRREVSAISMGTMQDIRPRQEQSHDNLRHALVVAGVLSAFVLGLCATVLWYFRRSILRERALEGTKSEFLSLASHQLRTPATNVKQYVGLLLDGYLGDLSDKQVDALKIAYKNNESEIRIMNDLLDVAKLDLKRIQLRKQRVNIVSIVSQVAKTYEPITTARGQTLTIKSPPELMAVVDRAYFKGVLEKLIDNAVKYSQNNTRISVKVRVDEVHDMFVIKVRDHGLGIKKRELPKLFMKFSRLDNEFSANTEGSGLGLYWVKQILALHGGSVDVVTEEGKGSKFIVRAPIGG
jgi:signal transduction histidine kinase